MAEALRTVTLSLPWPPSLNRIWRALGNRLILSTPARDYYRAACNVLAGTVAQPLRRRLVVTLHLRPPEKLRDIAWDVANREKLAMDVLTRQRVWLDDSQIDVMLIVRGEPQGTGCIDILIKEL